MVHLWQAGYEMSIFLKGYMAKKTKISSHPRRPQRNVLGWELRKHDAASSGPLVYNYVICPLRSE